MGFRTGLSTKEPIYILTTQATTVINQRRCLIAVILDAEKAFDTAWREGLIAKMISAEIQPNLKMIGSFPKDRVGKVYIEKIMSRKDPFYHLSST